MPHLLEAQSGKYSGAHSYYNCQPERVEVLAEVVERVEEQVLVEVLVLAEELELVVLLVELEQTMQQVPALLKQKTTVAFLLPTLMYQPSRR